MTAATVIITTIYVKCKAAAGQAPSRINSPTALAAIPVLRDADADSCLLGPVHQPLVGLEAVDAVVILDQSKTVQLPLAVGLGLR